MVVANVVENQKFNDINTITIPDNVLSPKGKPGAPANYLIIGSDSRAFVDTPEQAKAFGDAKDVGLARSDVMMVVHIEPARGHRVRRVVPPRHRGRDRGPRARQAQRRVRATAGPRSRSRRSARTFGIPIQHFLAVNFEGFRKIVDAIGHVKIYFPTPGARRVHRALPTDRGLRLARRRAGARSTRGRVTT